MYLTESGIAVPEATDARKPLHSVVAQVATTVDAAVRGRGSRVYRTTFGQRTANVALLELTRITVPDPGWEYTLTISARAETLGTGRVDLRASLNSGSYRWGYEVSTSPKHAVIAGDGWDQALTGESLVILNASRVGSWSGSMGTNGVGTYLLLTVNPHPEAATRPTRPRPGGVRPFTP